MRIYAWNVNGIRACVKKGFESWLGTCEADIVGLQEVRASPEQTAECLGLQSAGWHVDVVAGEKPGYSGVGLFSRIAPDRVESSLGVPRFDAEGRVQIAHFGPLAVVNCYFPNGGRDCSRIPYKLDFYEHLRELLRPRMEAGEPVLVMGDFNTAHAEIDLARPKQNTHTSGFRPEEREAFAAWLDAGWTDTFRHLHPDAEDRYTWWSQRKGVRERNVGWRIDYVLASPGAMAFVVGADIHDQVMGSDHCPVSVTLDDAVLGAG